MLSRLIMTVMLAIGLSASAQAQRDGNNRLQPMREQPMMMPGEVQGTIQAVMRGAIVVLDASNQAVQVDVPQEARVEVIGTATADYLQNGMIVEFKAEVDGRGVVKGNVGDLRIVTAETPGLFPPESAAGDLAGDVAKPAKRAAASKGAKDGKGAKDAKGAKGGAVTPGTYRIVGRISSTRNGKVAVRAGRATVTLELSDNPTINVESSDLVMAAIGDKVSAKGMKMVARDGTALSASEVKIEMAEPLAGAKKKGPAAKPDAKRPPKRPKKNDALPPSTVK